MNSYEVVSSYSSSNQVVADLTYTDTSQSGYLYKKGSSGNWQKRYFEINGSYLTYYKSHHMTKLLAAISLPQVGQIRITGEVSDSLGTGVVFELQLKDRLYYLRADTYEDARKWVDTLIHLRDGKAGGNSSNPLNYSSQMNDAQTDAMLAPSNIEPSAHLQKSTRSKFCCCFGH